MPRTAASASLHSVTPPLPQRAFAPVFLIALACAIALGSPLTAGEVFRTHAEVLRSAPIIVQARVDSYHPVGGVGQLYEFTLTRLDVLRGQVPGSFRVRIAVQSRVVDPDGLPDPPGSQWILLLDRKPTAEGYYVLHTLNYGKVELMQRISDGAMVLSRPLPPEEGGSLRYYSVEEFRRLIRRIERKDTR